MVNTERIKASKRLYEIADETDRLIQEYSILVDIAVKRDFAWNKEEHNKRVVEIATQLDLLKKEQDQIAKKWNLDERNRS